MEQGITPNSLEFWNLMKDEYLKRGDLRDNPIEYPLIAKNSLYSVLEFGCCFGMFYSYLPEEQQKTYVGVDISPALIAKAKEYHPSGHFIVGDILDSGFATNSFDTVIALQILEHFKDEDLMKALMEIKRIAKRRIIFSVPNRDSIPDRSHIQTFDYERVFDLLSVYGEVTFLPCQKHHILVMQDDE